MAMWLYVPKAKYIALYSSMIGWLAKHVHVFCIRSSNQCI